MGRASCRHQGSGESCATNHLALAGIALLVASPPVGHPTFPPATTPVDLGTLELPDSAQPQPQPQTQTPAPTTMPTLTEDFPGVSFQWYLHRWGAWLWVPGPDPNGDAGPNNCMQAVNTSIGIFSKTGTQQAAFTYDSFWAGAGTGTSCDTSNQGDPIVLYDPLADRFIFMDLAWADLNTGRHCFCLAVSKTSDPLGSY